jgi:FkbM family methyltransferase
MLKNWSSNLGNVQDIIEGIKNKSIKPYAFGRNLHAEHVLQYIPFVGIVDDFAEKDSVWCGLPVVRFEDLDDDAVLVNCVLSKRPHSGLKRIGSSFDIARTFHYCEFTKFSRDLFPPLPFTEAMEQTFKARSMEFASIYSLLADETSRNQFAAVLMYRLTGDPFFTAGFTINEENQYFDVDLTIPREASFVDGGGFLGETTLEFANRYPAYNAVYFFEPNPASFRSAEERLMGLRNVNLFKAALGSTFYEASFDSASRNASMICETGAELVEVVPLDSVINDKVDLIKFDLEGFELSALEGAFRVITEHSPALAICVYHKPEHFVEVPSLILSMGSKYSLLFRHYTEGFEESVMYFKPSNG